MFKTESSPARIRDFASSTRHWATKLKNRHAQLFNQGLGHQVRRRGDMPGQFLQGEAGIISTIPALSDATMVFGLGFIVWFIVAGLALILLKSPRQAQEA
jgi:hypothetical protein